MSECLNAVGFIFDSVKTFVKKDKKCKYVNYYCQNCVSNNNCHINKEFEQVPIKLGGYGGYLSPCDACTNNSQYKICIFKLKKSNFVSSSLGISTSIENAWDEFKKNIIYQRNGKFVISVTKPNNKMHSFYANLIKSKKCNCCDSILLYFKYNIISLKPCNELFNELFNELCNESYNKLNEPNNYPDQTQQELNPYQTVCANYESNITYNLKSGLYKSVKFFNSPNYTYKNYVMDCYPNNLKLK